MPPRLFGLLVLILALSIASSAQRGMPFSSVPTGGMGNAAATNWSAPVHVGFPGHVGVRFGPRPLAPVFPLGGVFFGADEQPPANIIINNIVPTEQANNTKAAVEEAPAAPLVIELEDGKWVRRRLVNVPPGDRGPQMLSEPQKLAARAPEPLQDAMLVFRDGRRQSVSSYTIFGGALYYSNPAWAPQQKVQLQDLDLPATTAANRQHGIEFRLPSAPNEVITRP